MLSLFDVFFAALDYLGAALTPYWEKTKGPLKFLLYVGLLGLLGSILVNLSYPIFMYYENGFNMRWDMVYASGALLIGSLSLHLVGFSLKTFSRAPSRRDLGDRFRKWGQNTQYMAILLLGAMLICWLTSFEPREWAKTIVLYGSIVSAILMVIFLSLTGIAKDLLKFIYDFLVTNADLDEGEIEDAKFDVVFKKIATIFGWFASLGLIIYLVPKAGVVSGAIIIFCILLIIIWDFSKDNSWKIAEKIIIAIPYIVILFYASDSFYDSTVCGTMPKQSIVEYQLDDKGKKITVTREMTDEELLEAKEICSAGPTSMWNGMTGALKDWRAKKPVKEEGVKPVKDKDKDTAGTGTSQPSSNPTQSTPTNKSKKGTGKGSNKGNNKVSSNGTSNQPTLNTSAATIAFQTMCANRPSLATCQK
jgi:hypothetical protein